MYYKEEIYANQNCTVSYVEKSVADKHGAFERRFVYLVDGQIVDFTLEQKSIPVFIEGIEDGLSDTTGLYGLVVKVEDRFEPLEYRFPTKSAAKRYLPGLSLLYTAVAIVKYRGEPTRVLDSNRELVPIEELI